LSYECHLTGQHQRAIEIRRRALEIWRATGNREKEGDTLRWLSSLNWFAGNHAEAKRYGIEAVETLEALPPGPELAMAYCIRADLDMEVHELRTSIDWAQRAIALAEPWADIVILTRALNTLGTVRLIGGDPSGWADLDRSLELALAEGLHEPLAGCYIHLSAMAVSSRRYDLASRHLSAGLAYCEEHTTWIPGGFICSPIEARMRFEQGNWMMRAPMWRRCYGIRVPHPLAASLRSGFSGTYEFDAATPKPSSALEEARALAGKVPGLQQVGTLAAVCAEAAWLSGDHDAVVREVRPAYDLVCGQIDPRMKGELAAWLWRANALEQHPSDIQEPYALEISGDWKGASRAWEVLGCPYEHACMLAWYGAEDEQRLALAMFEQLGATPAMVALRKQMRDRGVRGVPRGARTSTRSHPNGLTRREAEILKLLSDGLRNSAIASRLFVSTKTVDHHVSAILTKLGARTRAEAVALAHRQPGEVGTLEGDGVVGGTPSL
jgi:DNA-binding CsgD family transcriptional regulator